MSWQPSYATAAELAAWLGVENTGTELGLVTEAASRAIDRHCGRQFGLLSSSEFRWYTAEWFKDRWIIPIDDLMTEASLTVEIDNDQDGTPEAEITAYRLTPINAGSVSRPWTTIEILPAAEVKPNGLPWTIRVSARWGWTTVPDSIKMATLIQAARFYERRKNVSGPLSKYDVDDIHMGYASSATAHELDSDVALAIAPYRKLWIAV